MRALVVIALSLVACNPFGLDPPFDERETVRLDTESAIDVRLHVRPSFPDNVADVRLSLVRAGQRPLPVLEDWAQVQSLRAHTRATRLAPGGSIAVYLREKLCVLPAGAAAFACRSIGQEAPRPWSSSGRDPAFNAAFLSALEWVSNNQDVFSQERTRAAMIAADAPATTPQRTCATLRAATRGAERENNATALGLLDGALAQRRCPARTTR